MRSFLFVILFSFLISSHVMALIFAPDLEEGLQLLNSGQLLEAYSFLGEYKQKHPDDDEGLFLFALTKWKMMWLSSYSQADRQEVLELLEEVESLCRPKMSNDKDALFIYAAVLGIRAQIAATENEWWETAQLGKRMKASAEKVIKMDREYYEAYYLIGSYNYFADALPGYIKFLRTLAFLPGGDRNKGLRQLLLAYEKGHVASVEAGKTLALIYLYYEAHYEYGTRMCDHILSMYPQSFDTSLYKGINLYYSMSFDDSMEWLDKLKKEILAYSSRHLGDKNEVVPVYAPLEREVRYWISRNLIQLQQFELARGLLMELAHPPLHEPYWLIRWVYLSLAEIEYKLDHPQAAEQWLSLVLEWKDVKDSHKKADLLKEKKGEVGTFDIDFR
jgi:hypothetical protein